MAASEEIKGAVYAPRPFRGKVENFLQFEEEVIVIITSVFEKHRGGQDVFQKVCRLRIEVGSVIEAEISILFKFVYRRLIARMKAREPWMVTFTRDIPEEILLSIMEVVKKAPSAFGVTHTTTDVTYQIS